MNHGGSTCQAKKNPPKITTYNRGTVSERHIVKEQKKMQ